LQESKAFWLPSKAPEARTVVAKPDLMTYCPASRKKLKLKDLVPVKFTRVPEGQSGFAMDPVTGDTFTNSSRLVVLKSTGGLLACRYVGYYAKYKKFEWQEGTLKTRLSLYKASMMISLRHSNTALKHLGLGKLTWASPCRWCDVGGHL
jgi:hypothetical protein